jgi:hypothetical protein
MFTKTLALCITFVATAGPIWAGPPASAAADFTISNPSGVPGTTLEPGSYSISVVNHLSDRMILKVDSATGGVQATFLGVPNAHIDKPKSSGPVRWANPADGKQYLKGWYFPGAATVVEFVYPKAEAVAIATANPAKVPAIDPASEGKVTDNTLSKEDMQMLTLWMLTFEEVGPGNEKAGIKAERYQTVASVSHKPVIAALPHTGSQMPLLWLAGLGSLMMAGVLRVFFLSKTMTPVMAGQSRKE